MRYFKKILGVFVIMAAATFMFPTKALAEKYYRLSEFKSNETLLSGEQQCGANGEMCPYYPIPTMDGYLNLDNWYTQENSNHFSMHIVANDLEPEKQYKVTLTSDDMSSGSTFTGEELNEGRNVEINNTNGTVTLTITEKDTNTNINYMVFSCDGAAGECNDDNPVKALESISIIFNRNQQTQPGTPPGTPPGPSPEATKEEIAKLDEVFKKIAPEGKIKLNAVEPGKSDLGESVITVALNEYSVDGYNLYGSSYDGNDQLIIEDAEKGYINKTYDVKYEYVKPNATAQKIVEKVREKLKFTWDEIDSDYNKRFIVEDLESINYLYNIQRTKDETAAINSIVNYSSKIHKLSDNANIEYMFDVRLGGGESEFYEMVAGPMNIIYNGTVYGNIEPVGYSLTQIIYVPNETPNTREAFISAAKARINEYLKGIDVEITYGGKIEDLEEIQYSWEKYDGNTSSLEKLFDISKTNGEWYIIKIGKEEYKYFILKDSSKMNNPYVKTVDMNTNVYVTTEAFDAPLDSKINVNKLDPKSNEYKELLKKLNITDGISYDLKLYSTSLGMHVTKLADGQFEVYVPIDKKYNNKNLVAYYLKEDGTKEEYEVTVKDGYAMFKTNHFSVYTLTEKTASSTNTKPVSNKPTINNPQTGDKIMLYISLLGLSVIGLIGAGLYTKKKLFNK